MRSLICAVSISLKDHSPGFLKLTNDAKSRIKEISVQETLQRINHKEAILIDVREDHEWEAGHAKDATHLGRGIIERDIEHLIPDKEQPMVCYCGGGFRSALTADNLQKMGYQNVFSMTGGWSAWQEAGLPTE